MFRDFAKNNVVVFDGGMGTSIQNMELKEEDWKGKAGCSEYLNIIAPHIIETIHDNFLKSGADVIETNTFGGIRLVLSEYDLEDKVYDVNFQGAKIARKVADKYGKFVAGSMGPGTRLPSLGQISFDDMYFMYSEQAKALLDGGVDLFIIETCQDLLQTKSAIRAVFDILEKENKDLPVMVSVTIESTGTMLLGSDLSAVAETLRGYPIFSLGINCALGPDMMHSPLNTLSDIWDGRISCIPNAGLPETVNGKVVYNMSAEKMSGIMFDLVNEFNLNIVGGCCGTTYEHIAEIKEKVKNLIPGERTKKKYSGTCSSIYTATPLIQTPPPALIGERANSNGSKAFRELLLAEDFEGMLRVAKNQEDTGAHFIDLCVAYVGRDESKDMAKFISMVNRTLTAPAVIDSTDPKVIEESLKRYAGKPVINSINLEDGGEKLHQMLKLIKKFPAASIALTIDETGMAMTCERKFAVAEKIYNIWTNDYGLPPEDLIFDPLTFSIGSGDETLVMSAVETLNAIKTIKEKLKGVKTVLGLSNVSFGLTPASRVVLNSVFLNEAVKYGLDMAIVHASKVLPDSVIDDEKKQFALDLIYGKKGALEKFIEAFSDFSLNEEADKDENLTDEEALKKKLLKGDKTELEPLLDRLLKNYKPYEIINDLLLNAMKEVGELFGAGKMLLPFVLQSAEVMKKSVSYLEKFIKTEDVETKGKVVLATVKGDVHDIGKNLVEIILTNNGYKVFNLGIKVPVEEMIKKAVDENVDAIGMSGLLVKSTVFMKENIEEIKRNNLNLKVLLGGAALTEGFVKKDCEPYLPGKVYYCSDAFDALEALEKSEVAQPGIVVSDLDIEQKEDTVINNIEVENVEKRSDTEILNVIPETPFTGIKILNKFDFYEVLKFMNKQALFNRRWNYLKQSDPNFEEILKNNVLPEYENIVEQTIRLKLADMKAVYGFFKCYSKGDSIFVLKNDKEYEFKFTRQKSGEHLCLSDYVRSKEDGGDYIAMQVVTVGQKPLEYALSLKEKGNYKDYFLYHGFFSELAEAMAEYLHKKIRSEWGLGDFDARTIDGILNGNFRGQRFSFGYASCPDMFGNKILGDLLEMKKNIQISLTDSYEMVPEYSTCALIFHHPEAKHFVIK